PFPRLRLSNAAQNHRLHSYRFITGSSRQVRQRCSGRHKVILKIIHEAINYGFLDLFRHMVRIVCGDTEIEASIDFVGF
ncbi:hypothetical protein, partial [Burkholderia ubonensis]|uniref:hypothetical protein n=1 Tax=Burkholderia ubonensis TaxID=101571 RepID=UPI001E31C7A4